MHIELSEQDVDSLPLEKIISSLARRFPGQKLQIECSKGNTYINISKVETGDQLSQRSSVTTNSRDVVIGQQNQHRNHIPNNSTPETVQKSPRKLINSGGLKRNHDESNLGNSKASKLQQENDISALVSKIFRPDQNGSVGRSDHQAYRTPNSVPPPALSIDDDEDAKSSTKADETAENGSSSICYCKVVCYSNHCLCRRAGNICTTQCGCPDECENVEDPPPPEERTQKPRRTSITPNKSRRKTFTTDQMSARAAARWKPPCGCKSSGCLTSKCACKNLGVLCTDTCTCSTCNNCFHYDLPETTKLPDLADTSA